MHYQPQYTPGPPPEAACASLNPAMLSGQIHIWVFFFSQSSPQRRTCLYIEVHLNQMLGPAIPPHLVAHSHVITRSRKDTCPNQNKNTDFSVQTPFPQKKKKKTVNIQRPLCSTLQSQRTFKSPSGGGHSTLLLWFYAASITSAA